MPGSRKNDLSPYRLKLKLMQVSTIGLHGTEKFLQEQPCHQEVGETDAASSNHDGFREYYVIILRM